MDTVDIILTDSKDREVDAVARPIDVFGDTLSYFIDWFPLMYDLAGNPLYQDSHWYITEYWEEMETNENLDTIIIEYGNKIQGHATIKWDHKDINKEKSIYITFAATAPWNRKLTEKSRREFKNVGQILFALACIRGIHRGAKTMELHSLSEAEKFYRRIGMVETGNSKGLLKEFHLDEKGVFDLILRSKRYFKLKAIE